MGKAADNGQGRTCLSSRPSQQRPQWQQRWERDPAALQQPPAFGEAGRRPGAALQHADPKASGASLRCQVFFISQRLRCFHPVQDALIFTPGSSASFFNNSGTDQDASSAKNLPCVSSHLDAEARRGPAAFQHVSKQFQLQDPNGGSSQRARRVQDVESECESRKGVAGPGRSRFKESVLSFSLWRFLKHHCLQTSAQNADLLINRDDCPFLPGACPEIHNSAPSALLPPQQQLLFHSRESRSRG